ncbi:proteasome assembly chaperone 1-like [Saccostrea echinata]|uniref:proteasome assembly chaperone 1-like n=1 Tax=Saccostrea echinata TaxID=191078 RepID=UPI002A82E6BA|nr:proteasome assembly chaperone 1-like [Saccostrea echinata]
MATFFGEILPVISRAVDDDEEEESFENLETSVKLRWKKEIKEELELTKDEKLQVDAFVLAIGPAATGFTQTYVTHKNYEVIGGLFCGMKEDDVNTFGQTSPTDKTCYIYRKCDYPSALVCECNYDVRPEYAHSFVNQLMSFLNLSEGHVVILSSAFTSEYKSEIPTSDMNPPFLRALKTTQFLGTPLAPYLEQPNVVTGLGAQVMTYCHIHKIKALLYVCYTDTIHLDFATMKTFQPLIETTPIHLIREKNTKASETLKKIVDLHTKHSTLYL